MNICQTVSVFLLTVYCVTGQRLAPDREQPLSLQYATEIYRNGNLCPYLSVGGNIVPYNYWTCGLPLTQRFCGQEATAIYDCCPGFKSVSFLPGRQGTCAETESVWKMLYEVISDYHGRKDFGDVILNAGLQGFRNNQSDENIYTVFLPHGNEHINNLQTFRGGRDRHPVKSYVAEDRVYLKDLRNKAVIKNLYGEDLKVTTYSNGLMCIECRAVIKPDIEARNGLIQYIDGPIWPHSGAGFARRTVYEALQTSARSFARDLPSDVRTMLQTTSATWFTVFAPSDEVWNRIQSNYQQHKGLIARNHVLKKMICSVAISRKSTSLGPTLADEYLGVDCIRSGQRVILDACGKRVNIRTADVMSGNGVVHVIDSVLIPYAAQDARSAFNCINSAGLYKIDRIFTRFSSKCQMPSGKVVWLIPNNDAYALYDRTFTSTFDYCQLMNNHIFKLDSRGNINWKNGAEIISNSGRKGFVYYLKNRLETRMYFNGARTTTMKPIRFSGGYIYIIDRISLNMYYNNINAIFRRPDISKTWQFISDSRYNLGGSYKLFLASRNLGWSTRKEVNWSGRAMQKFLQLHTVSVPLWGGQYGYFRPGTVSTYESSLRGADGKPFMLKFKFGLDGQMKIGYDGLSPDHWSLVIKWNLAAQNGMVWIIDWPMICPSGLCN